MVGLRDIRQISVSGTVPDSYKQKKRPQPDFTRLITGAKIGFILVASKLITIGLFYGL